MGISEHYWQLSMGFAPISSTLCVKIMKSNCEELISLLVLFDGDLECTGQGWADVGADMCEERLNQFNDADWNDLYNKFKALPESQQYLLIYALQLAPDIKGIPILIELLLSKNEKIWQESLIELSSAYSRTPESLDTVTITKDMASLIISKCSIQTPKYYHPKDPEIAGFIEYVQANT